MIDPLKIGDNDPLPLRIIQRRRLAAPERSIRYIRRGVYLGHIASVRRAAARAAFVVPGPVEALPGFFSMAVVREGSGNVFGETLTTGEANTKLKIVPSPDGWFRVELL